MDDLAPRIEDGFARCYRAMGAAAAARWLAHAAGLLEADAAKVCPCGALFLRRQSECAARWQAHTYCSPRCPILGELRSRNAREQNPFGDPKMRKPPRPRPVATKAPADPAALSAELGAMLLGPAAGAGPDPSDPDVQDRVLKLLVKGATPASVMRQLGFGDQGAFERARSGALALQRSRLASAAAARRAVAAVGVAT